MCLLFKRKEELMLRIAFLINSLGGGGAERVLTDLVNHMDKTKFDVTIITMFGAGVNVQFLNNNIHHISRNSLKIKGLSKFIKYISPDWLYHHYFGQDNYDILVAFLHGAPTRAVWGAPDKIPKIAWFHSQMEHSSFSRYYKNKDELIECCKAFNKLICVSNSVCESLTRLTGINEDIITIYNTIDTNRILKLSREPIVPNNTPDNVVRIVSLGRLAKEKGYVRLTDAVKKMVEDRLRFVIDILGSGPEETNIRENIRCKGLGGYIRILGFKENPYPYMINADIYLCCSFEEGLNTAMCEALVLGRPVISTNVSGAYEILGKNNEYGIVAENSTEAIYYNLKQMVESPELLERYRKNAAVRGMMFNRKETVKSVETMFLDVYNSRNI